MFSILAIAVLGGLFFVLKPKETPVTQPTEKTFELIIKDKKIVSGPETIQVTQGDYVVLKITADEPEELHIHGYDKSVELEKDVQAQLAFTADLTGSFELELEKSKTEIGTLEVQPK